MPLSEIEPFLKNLRVVDEFEHLPYVVGLEEDRLRGSNDQVAYVKGLEGAQPGQRYAVVRPSVRFTRLDRTACCDMFYKDDLDFRGRRIAPTTRTTGPPPSLPDKGYEQLGYELVQITTGTVTRGEGGGVEATTFVLDDGGREVRVGDRLIPVEAQPYDLQFFPHPPKQQFEYGRAQVIARRRRTHHGGPRDIVALSVGARDGVDNGTVFSIWRVGSNVPDRVEYSNNRSEDLFGEPPKVRLPDEFAGHVMVFRTFDKVSYGLIMDSIKPTAIGYELKHPDACRNADQAAVDQDSLTVTTRRRPRAPSSFAAHAGGCTSCLRIDDPDYPALLRRLPDAPALLYVRGDDRAACGIPRSPSSAAAAPPPAASTTHAHSRGRSRAPAGAWRAAWRRASTPPRTWARWMPDGPHRRRARHRHRRAPFRPQRRADGATSPQRGVVVSEYPPGTPAAARAVPAAQPHRRRPVARHAGRRGRTCAPGR